MKLEIFAVVGVGEILPGDDIALAIHQALESQALESRSPASQALETSQSELLDGDVVVVTQKIVSKAEGRIVSVRPAIDNSNTDNSNSDVSNSDHSSSDVSPASPASETLPTPSEVVARESVRILRRRGDLVISETSHGFICANAGVDFSNVPAGSAALLPRHPDRSAQLIRDRLFQHTAAKVAVVVSDTFGRPWRRGLTDVAIGCSGILPILDLRGQQDALGRELAVTEIAIVDEIASAAELVMGKTSNTPVAIIRGVPTEWLTDTPTPPGKSDVVSAGVVSDLVRHPNEDLFR